MDVLKHWMMQTTERADGVLDVEVEVEAEVEAEVEVEDEGDAEGEDVEEYESKPIQYQRYSHLDLGNGHGHGHGHVYGPDGLPVVGIPPNQGFMKPIMHGFEYGGGFDDPALDGPFYMDSQPFPAEMESYVM